MNSEWRTVELGDHVDLLTGFPFKSACYVSGSGESVRLLRGDNIGQGLLRWDDAKHWSQPDCADYDDFQLREGDVILAMDRPWIAAGLKYAWVRSTDLPCLLVQRVARMRGINDLSTNYLRYVVGSRDFIAYVNGIITGVNVPHISGKDIKRFQFRMPSLAEQERIVSILVNYDDLIEINRRRIELSDEMARRIFEASIISSQDYTEGTKAADLITSTLGGDWGSEASSAAEPRKVRIIRGTDFRRVQLGDFSTTPTRFISEQSLKRRALRPFDVIVENSINAKTRSAGTPLLVSPGLIDALRERVIAASFCRQFHCEAPQSAVVLFHFMSWLHRTGRMREFQVVAANGIANFQSEQFLQRAVVPILPDKIKLLGKQLAPFSAMNIQRQIFNLTQQRELLLPRLVSGDLPVSDAEHELETAA